MYQSHANIPEKVINYALKLIESESKWKKHSIYGEECQVNTEKYSLGCALQIAQRKIRGKAFPRAKEMWVLRRQILKHFFFRGHLHPITYFNRNKKTKYADVIFILNKSLKKLKN